MTKEHIDNDNKDYSVTSNVISNTSDIDLLEVFNALESVGFRFTDYHKN